MKDKLEDLCFKYKLDYGRTYDLYLFIETRMIKRDFGVCGLLYANRLKYVEPVIGLMNRYYRRKER